MAPPRRADQNDVPGGRRRQVDERAALGIDPKEQRVRFACASTSNSVAVARAHVGIPRVKSATSVPLRPTTQRTRPITSGTDPTVLYRTLETHWSAFLERAEEAGGLPRFVRGEVEEYLGCGILEHGCVRVGCSRCGFERLVAFSCKRRGFCPSCLGRRMADTALLVAHIDFDQEISW